MCSELEGGVFDDTTLRKLEFLDAVWYEGELWSDVFSKNTYIPYNDALFYRSLGCFLVLTYRHQIYHQPAPAPFDLKFNTFSMLEICMMMMQV